ncbi:hypothetical protein [Paenibacillus popilliae]|uniref:Phosphoglycerate mutase 1 n=1 Tax=Paenibacillus popilliae ATCC 14706 TaxID=1212764 RepID=M9LYJ7_PAEPP|nr:hypothetical protein [Paenibacillus popilliae]GAC41179.1 phosphoglycerate mutase 1 [Paenibacillus popilliae ATCC 14706]
MSDNPALYGNAHGKPDQEVYAQVNDKTFEVIRNKPAPSRGGRLADFEHD